MSSRCISHLLFVLINWCNGQSSSRVENEPEAGGERAPSLKSLELKMVRIGALQSRSERRKRLIITAKIQPARPRGALNRGRRTLVAFYPNMEKGKEGSSVRSRARSEHLTQEPHVTEPSRCATLGVREDIRDFEREIRAGFINNLEVIGK